MLESLPPFLLESDLPHDKSLIFWALWRKFIADQLSPDLGIVIFGSLTTLLDTLPDPEVYEEKLHNTRWLREVDSLRRDGLSVDEINERLKKRDQ